MTRLLPSVQRIHGKTRHTGKVPLSASLKTEQPAEEASAKKQAPEAPALSPETPDRELSQLRKQLDQCTSSSNMNSAPCSATGSRELEKGTEEKGEGSREQAE